MSEWIINRRPTVEDADYMGRVWVTTENGVVLRQRWDYIRERAWMPIDRPKPYVKPNSWIAEWSDAGSCWTLWTKRGKIVMLKHLTHRDAHREAAERIAAIYEEVMP